LCLLLLLLFLLLFLPHPFPLQIYLLPSSFLFHINLTGSSAAATKVEELRKKKLFKELLFLLLSALSSCLLLKTPISAFKGNERGAVEAEIPNYPAEIVHSLCFF
jgi:hypothetical protein